MKKDIVLDKYEQEIETSLARGEFKPVKNLEETKKLFEEAAKNYREMHQTKSITLRVNKEDLIKVKAKAIKNGIPYQRLVSALLHRYAQSKTNIRI